MALFIKLDKNIDANNLIKKIQELIQGHSSDSILYIDIKTVSRDDISLIPKLEYKKTPEISGA